MFIQTEDTPNPATMKFLPGCDVLGNRPPVDIPERSAAGKSPLAEALFAVDGVKGVMLGSDFITVTRVADGDWPEIKQAVLAAITEHFTSGKPVLAEGAPVVDDEDAAGGDDAIVRQICELLDQRIRPAVAQDGGDIAFQSYEDGIVYLTLKGACAGCPSATATLKAGVERILKHFIPEIREVRQSR